MDIETLLQAGPASNRPIVLIADNQPEESAVLKAILQDECEIVRTAVADTLAATRTVPVDLIFLDVALPDMAGFEVCAQLKAQPELAAVPVIFVAPRTGEHDEERAFALGAVDYVYKPLSPAILRNRMRLHLRLRQALEQLEKLASTDHLTTTWNRRHFEQAAHDEIARSRRYRQPLSLLFFDIDFFKQVNDQYGHQAGDSVLRDLAHLIQSSIRHSDTLARWGGEEFTLLTPSTCLGEARVIAEKLRVLTADHRFQEVGKITISLGVAEYQPQESLEDWLRRADQALLMAKDQGRNQIDYHPATAYWYPGDHEDQVYQPLVQLIWRDSYNSGHPLVDSQHQELFIIANELLVAVIGGMPPDKIHAILGRLLDHTVRHFTDEEGLQRQYGYPGWESHQLLHQELVQRALAMEQNFLAGNLEIATLFGFLAYDVVARHMLQADREFYPYLVRSEPEILEPHKSTC